MKRITNYILITLLVLRIGATIAQTDVQLAGGCIDCAAVITSFANCSVSSAGTLKACTPVGGSITQTIQVVASKYSFLASTNRDIYRANIAGTTGKYTFNSRSPASG